MSTKASMALDFERGSSDLCLGIIFDQQLMLHTTNQFALCNFISNIGDTHWLEQVFLYIQAIFL